MLEENTLQSGSAIEINGNVDGGVLLGFTTTTNFNVDEDGNVLADEDGNAITTQTLATASAISQIGPAPAILIDGEGTPITLGVVGVAPNLDAVGVSSNTEGFATEADLPFGFVNQGTITAQGILDLSLIHI